jgi:hypothetical protein
VKLRDTKRRARYYFWIGGIGTIVFGFCAFVMLLNNLRVALQNFEGLFSVLGGNLSALIGDLIKGIYSYTSFIPFFWDDIWPILPELNLDNIFQESNYYFLAIIAATLFFRLLFEKYFWLRARISQAISEAEADELTRDVKKQRGSIKEEGLNVMELEINLKSNPDPWYKKPTGIVIIGIMGTIIGRIIAKVLGV